MDYETTFTMRLKIAMPESLAWRSVHQKAPMAAPHVQFMRAMRPGYADLL